MININELSMLKDFKYIHLSDKISKGEVNLDGDWIRYYDRWFCQKVNFDDFILNVGTTIYGDDHIIYQKDGTIFIKEQSKEMFKSNGDIIGYLFNIENRWSIIRREGNKKLPFNSWRKELYGLVCFVSFCLLTIVGGTKGLFIGLLTSLSVGVFIGIVGYYVLSSKIKKYVREYIRLHEYDNYSKILIQDYLE